MAAKRNRPVGLNAVRRRKVLEGYREHANYTRAAEAAGVSYGALWYWRRDNPDFQAELDALGSQYDEQVGHLARNVLRQHLDDVIERRTIEKRRQIPVTLGKDRDRVEIHDTVDTEPMHINASLVRMALNKLDPEYTTPPKQVDTLKDAEVQADLDAADAADKEG